MRTILFDFDGTLADTSRGIVSSYQNAFSSLGLPVPEMDFIKRTIGPPLKDMLRILSPQSDEAEIDALAVEYRKSFSESGLFEMDFYDGILDLLKRISIKSKIGIVSSKPEPFIVRILDRYALSGYFTYVSGVSLGFNNKSKKERLADLITDNELNPSDCIMVGDRSEDYNSAIYAGIGFIGVGYGFGTENEFPANTEVARTPADLLLMITAFVAE